MYAVVCGTILKKTFDRSLVIFVSLTVYVCLLALLSGALLLLICVTILLAHLLHTFSTTITCVSVGVFVVCFVAIGCELNLSCCNCFGCCLYDRGLLFAIGIEWSSADSISADFSYS